MINNKRFLKIVALLIMLVMSMYMLTGCEINKLFKGKDDDKNDTTSYEEPIKNIIDGLEKADSKTLLKAFPEFIATQVSDVFTDEYLENAIEKAKEEYGNNIKMSYKVTDKTEIEADEIRKIEEAVQTSFNKQINITKGYEIEVDVTTKGDDDEDTEKDVFNVYEIDGKWYLLDL